MVNINQELCIGCGVCVSLCPQVFELSSEFKAIVVNKDGVDDAQTAANSCPVQAIEIN